MKPLLPVLLAALLAPAALAPTALAQGLTITRPGSPATPAPSASAPGLPSLDGVPAGWRVLGGRVRAPQDARLPAGSTVSVAIEDVTRMNVPRPTLLRVEFPATRLSAPYQLQFNPVRLSPSRVYAVTARVTGPDGRVLYRTATVQELPQSRRAALDVRVLPVR